MAKGQIFSGIISSFIPPSDKIFTRENCYQRFVYGIWDISEHCAFNLLRAKVTILFLHFIGISFFILLPKSKS